MKNGLPPPPQAGTSPWNVLLPPILHHRQPPQFPATAAAAAECENVGHFTRVATLASASSEIHSLTLLLGNGDTFLYAGGGTEDNIISTWRHPGLTESGGVCAGSGAVKALAPAGAGLVASAHGDSKIRLWRRSRKNPGVHKRAGSLLPTGLGLPLPLRRFIRGDGDAHAGAVTCLVYDAGGDLLYSGSEDATVKAWRVADAACADTLRGHAGSVTALALGKDGVVFSASDDSTVRVWRRCRRQRHEAVATLFVQHFPVKAVAATRGRLYAGCSDGKIHCWLIDLPAASSTSSSSSSASAEVAFSYGGFVAAHAHAVSCLCVAGEWMVSGSADATVRVWRRRVGVGVGGLLLQRVAVLEGHQRPVKAVAAELLGHAQQQQQQRLVIYSAGLDGNVLVWMGWLSFL